MVSVYKKFCVAESGGGERWPDPLRFPGGSQGVSQGQAQCRWSHVDRKVLKLFSWDSGLSSDNLMDKQDAR